MPDDDLVTNNNADGDAEPPKPDFATKQDLAEVLDAVRQQTATMQEHLETIAARQGVTVQPYIDEEEETPDPTDEDDENTRTTKIVAKMLKPIKQGMRAFQQVGLGTIEKLSRNSIIPTLPHYKRFEKEIEGQLMTLKPEVRAQPEAISMAYNIVCSMHMQELIDEGIEARMRKDGADGGRPGAPGSRRGADQKVEAGVPSMKDLGWNEDQISTIEARGGPDAWARRMSGGRYKGWADYAKAHARTGSGSRMGEGK